MALIILLEDSNDHAQLATLLRFEPMQNLPVFTMLSRRRLSKSVAIQHSRFPPPSRGRLSLIRNARIRRAGQRTGTGVTPYERVRATCLSLAFG